ncbi:MAG: Rid family detoxifying hydrolase [Bacteroidia bacterium]|nr:Rid family detoxifying hydrolase [Bacteroidia bacterium]
MKRIIKTDKAPRAAAVYNQAVEAGSTLYISGQIALDPATGKLVEGGIKEQTDRVISNMLAILEAAGYQIDDMVKITCMIADMSLYPGMNEVYGKYFYENAPARAALAAAGLPLGALVEMDAVAVRSKQ